MCQIDHSNCFLCLRLPKPKAVEGVWYCNGGSLYTIVVEQTFVVQLADSPNVSFCSLVATAFQFKMFSNARRPRPTEARIPLYWAPKPFAGQIVLAGGGV